MPVSTTGKNFMLDALGGVAVWVSLHTANPGDNGASELTEGGSPTIYTRQLVTWNAAAVGNLDSSNQPVFGVTPATTVSHFGVWSAFTGGTFYGGGALSASESFTNEGTYTLTDLDFNLTDA